MGEIEAQTLGVHQRPLLGDMATQHLAQGGVKQVCGGVIERGRGAHIRIHFGPDLGIHG